MTPVIIIGAGIAGMACARRLADAGMAPVGLDKGRGIGGRVATPAGGGFAVRSWGAICKSACAVFASVLDTLENAGTLAGWADGTGRTHMVGVPGMSALPKRLE